MPATPKYGITTATPGGSSGAWGAITNAAFDSLDTTLYPLAGKLSEVGLLALTSASSQFGWQIDASQCGASSGQSPLYIPIPFAKPGVRITGFTSRSANTGYTGNCKLVYYDANGVETVVSTGHAIPSGATSNATTSGLTHDCATGRQYFLKIDLTGTGGVSIYALSVAVQASP